MCIECILCPALSRAYPKYSVGPIIIRWHLIFSLGPCGTERTPQINIFWLHDLARYCCKQILRLKTAEEEQQIFKKYIFIENAQCVNRFDTDRMNSKYLYIIYPCIIYRRSRIWIQAIRHVNKIIISGYRFCIWKKYLYNNDGLYTLKTSTIFVFDFLFYVLYARLRWRN